MSHAPSKVNQWLRSGTPVLALISTLLGLAVARADEAPDLSGAQLYQAFCASCHGAQAHGDGSVSPYMNIKVPDLTRISTRYGGKFPALTVHEIIDGQRLRPGHGSRDMPAWGWEFYVYAGDDDARRKRTDELIDRLVDYLRSIQQP